MTEVVPSIALAKPQPEANQFRHLQVAAQHLVDSSPRCQNARSSLFKIPNEVLIDIIGLCSREHFSRWMVKTTTRVCWRWRSVLIGAPLLWRTIDLVGCEDFLRLCLARSVGVGIRLVLTDSGVHHNVTKDILISLLTPHFPRVTKVHLSACGPQELLPLEFLVTGISDLPNLVSFDLSLVVDDILEGHPPVFKDTSPPFETKLQHLSLSFVLVIWPTTTLSQLTSLELFYVPFHGLKTSLDAFLDMLSEASNSLKTFTYIGDGGVLAPQRRTSELVIALPNMQCFHISAPAVDVALVLAHISLPHTARLELKVVEDDEDPYIQHEDEKPMFSEFLPLRNRVLLPTLSDARGVMVSSQLDVVKVYAHSKCTKSWQTHPWRSCSAYSWPDSASDFARCTVTPSFCLSYDLPVEAIQPQLARIIKDLARCFPPTVEAFVLRASICPAIHKRDIWLSMLYSFPNLRELDIIADDCNIQDFPTFLRPTRSGTPCVHLQHLLLNFDVSSPTGEGTLVQLIETLNARAREGCRLSSLTLWLDHANPDLAWAPVAFTAFELEASRLPDEYEDFQADLEALVDVFTVEVKVEVRKKPAATRKEKDDDSE
ncbi:hypothetical protein C8Q72DRAFT_351240 [Fomitopsis betulina]|nr:hypothetical protein C8Q72DRAFT_351240 [Fomitopsis betulina]